ncbi:MAG: hypothetical protein DME94_07960 [Verrucomicrobia bacterium]|nr:MAG: hypothetical protein DME94_07960 [Verrucomicrobiota bacterium]
MDVPSKAVSPPRMIGKLSLPARSCMTRVAEVDSNLASGTADLLGTNESKTTCDFNGNFALCPPRN